MMSLTICKETIISRTDQLLRDAIEEFWSRKGPIQEEHLDGSPARSEVQTLADLSHGQALHTRGLHTRSGQTNGAEALKRCHENICFFETPHTGLAEIPTLKYYTIIISITRRLQSRLQARLLPR